MFESLSDFHRKESVSLSFVSNIPVARLNIPELRLNLPPMHQTQVRCVPCYHGTERAMASLADHLIATASRAANDSHTTANFAHSSYRISAHLSY